VALSAEQRKRVAWLIDGHLADDADLDSPEFWARWEREFAALSSPEELYLLASESHPNQSPEEWRRVLDSPHCDMGTALLVFWRNDPVYHYGYAGRDEVPDINRPSYDLVREIERRYLAGEYPHAVVRFDPAAFKGFSFLDGQPAEAVERVPAALRRASRGVPVPQLAAEDFEWGTGF
jgi:hypothetical protein